MSYYPKTCNFTICSIYRHGGQSIRMIQANFYLNWPSGFRGEDYEKKLQPNDGRQVMAIGELKMVKVTRMGVLMLEVKN